MAQETPPGKPSFEYQPHSGSSGPPRPETKRRITANSYANISRLRERLAKLRRNVNVLENKFQENMKDLGMQISNQDLDFRAAHQSLFYDDDPGDVETVTYSYYRTLESVDNASAQYIRRKFEEAARDVPGDSVVDLYNLNKIIKDEIGYIEQFLDEYVGDVDDSSEQRVLELFQDWTETAIYHSNVLSTLFKEKDTQDVIHASQIAIMDPDDAQKGQALFKFRLNTANDQIAAEFQVLKRNFSDFADVFYRNYLGPAVKLRLDGTRNLYPQRAGRLGEEFETMRAISENHLNGLIADQLRRNMIFDTKMKTLGSLIKMRDVYRNIVRDFASVGRRVPSDGPGIMVKGAKDDPSVSERIVSNTQSTNSFSSAHSRLSGRFDIDAHPQYLPRVGGNIEGDITVNEGVRIAGVDLPNHTHTGEDGTTQISGDSIIPGTLSANTVNTEDVPPAPINLKFANATARAVSSEANVYDIKVMFDGETGMQYEVQISRLDEQ